MRDRQKGSEFMSISEVIERLSNLKMFMKIEDSENEIKFSKDEYEAIDTVIGILMGKTLKIESEAKAKAIDNFSELVLNNMSMTSMQESLFKTLAKCFKEREEI